MSDIPACRQLLARPRLALLLLSAALLLPACSAVSSLQTHDAETEPAGSTVDGIGVAVAPNLYALNDRVNEPLAWTLDPAIVWFIRSGLTDRVDVTGTMWASNLPLLSLAWGSMDLGARGACNVMLTERASPNKVAVGFELGGYGTSVGTITLRDVPHKGVGILGVGGAGLTLSRALGPITTGEERTTLSFCLRWNYLAGNFNIEPNGADSAVGRLDIPRPISQAVIAPSLAVRVWGGFTLEVGAFGTRSPWTGQTEWTVHAGASMQRKQ